MLKRAAAFIGGMLVFFLSFFTTLRFVHDSEPSLHDRILQISDSYVHDEASLIKVANAAGLQHSTTVHMAVDVLRRVGDQIAIAGWALDSNSDALAIGAPTAILGFSEGKRVLSAETRGERPDLKVVGRVSMFLAYSSTFSCVAGKAFLMIAVAPTARYSVLKPQICP